MNSRRIVRRETDGFLLQRKMLQKSFRLLRAHTRVVKNGNLDTQNSWKKKFHKGTVESHLIVLVIRSEARQVCPVFFFMHRKLLWLPPETESLNQESYTCDMKITLNTGGGRSVTWAQSMILNNDRKLLKISLSVILNSILSAFE